MKHADVKEALDLAEGEVGEESKRICRMGGAALSEGHIAPAKAAIAYSEKLAVLAKKIAALRGEWEALQSEIDSPAEDVKPKRKSARDFIGYGRRFNPDSRSTAEVMAELREGEEM